MPAHLRPLSKCAKCGRPATAQLFNTRNAAQGTYCDRHAKAALARFQRDYEQRRPT